MTPNTINQLGPYIAQLLPKVLGVTLNTITLIGSMYFMLYFMLVNGRRMEESLYEYIPLKDGNVELIGKEVKTMVISNTIGTRITKNDSSIKTQAAVLDFQPFFSVR